MKSASGSPAGNGQTIYRLYPVADPAVTTTYENDRNVCGDCVSGACCSSEGPIALSAFDILRLATHLDLTPENFLKLFTQDVFDGCPFDPAAAIDDPANSTVTYLRRRGPEAFSPCIFLKYVAAPGAVPRRVCSVHEARPLACREYYFDTCKTRWTGELALSMADAFRALAAGRVSAATARARLLALHRATHAPNSLSHRWQRAIWTEVVRAAGPDQVNNEGTAHPALASMQRPVAAKLAHMLNKRHLRFEEEYGSVPRDEQLQRYQSAPLDAGERERLVRIARRRAARRIHDGGDYPYIAGLRFLSPQLMNGPAAKTTVSGGGLAPVDAIRRGLSFIGAIASQIVTRGPSPDREADRACQLRLMACLSLVDLDRIPRGARDAGLLTARRRLAGRLSRTLAREVAWVAGNKPPARDVARWWRDWAMFEPTDAPLALRRQVTAARRRLALPRPLPRPARIVRKPLSRSGVAHILARQDGNGSWGANPDPVSRTLSHDRYVDAVLRQTAQQVQRLSDFIQARTPSP